MGLLDNRVCEDDINRVNAIRHHPKYMPGFEEESREEKVWYEKDSNGLPIGYNLFCEVQEQYDNWQRQQRERADSIGGTDRADKGLSSSKANIGSSKVNLSKEPIEPIEKEPDKKDLWDSLWDWLYKKVNAWVDKI